MRALEPYRVRTLVRPALLLAALAAAAAGAPLAAQEAAAAPAPPASDPAQAATAAKPKELPKIELVEKGAFPLPAHLEQKDVAAGKIADDKLFEAGGDLFHTRYNGLDGVGAMLTAGGKPLRRFSAGPVGGGQPITVGAQACGSCHSVPVAAGAGHAHTRVLSDPGADGAPPFNARGTTSLHGNGLLQLLAQEMTAELQAARAEAEAAAKRAPGTAVRRELRAKGVEFGSLAATADATGTVSFDTSGVAGVDPDLVVRPFGWKGFVPNLRAFVVAAANAGMGMQSEEFAWRLPAERQPDPDADGVARELSVGDVTAITIYNAGQETPHGVEHLAGLGLVAAPEAADLERVARGRELFARVGCASCHRPEMRLANAVFEEPTAAAGGAYLDRFLAGKDADYDPARPVRFDLLSESEAPRAEKDGEAGAVVRLYGDLKRHRMGRHLADTDPQPVFDASLAPVKAGEGIQLVPADVFLTAELWGVGSTSPYLHDDRAGSLAEAIALHGEESPPPPGDAGRSEAQEARDGFLALAETERAALVSFLKSLVHFELED
jgi:hypothetical protein